MNVQPPRADDIHALRRGFEDLHERVAADLAVHVQRHFDGSARNAQAPHTAQGAACSRRGTAFPRLAVRARWDEQQPCQTIFFMASPPRGGVARPHRIVARSFSDGGKTLRRRLSNQVLEGEYSGVVMAFVRWHTRDQKQ
jgi:hypothetical protein